MTALDIIPAPGMLTDQEQPIRPDGTAAVDMRELVELGYEWISFQLVNGQVYTGIDIDKYGRASGFKSTGCWGVVYDVGDFHAFGKRLANAAGAAGADHVIVDAEQCAKYTRANRGLLPIVVGLRDGGWSGPVHLTTLGAPVNGLPHGPNDFEIDTDDFLATGGGLLPQAYFNAYDEYRPDLCVDYWIACGVPADRINAMIELAVEPAKSLKITGEEWVPLLEDAGIGQNFCAYMTQHGTDDDWAALAELFTSTPAPPDPDPEDEMEQVSDQQGRDAIGFAVQAAAQNWTDDKPRGRLTVCRRIAQAGNDDPKWNAIRDQVVALLDGAGIPK